MMMNVIKASLPRYYRQLKYTLTQTLARSLSTESPSKNDADEYVDILIVGGGAVGCGTARLLNERLPQLSVGVVEAREAPTVKKETSKIPHPRSYALSPNSLQLLGSNVTPQLALGYYTSMQVWQARSPASLTFTTNDVDADPMKVPYLGACVEDAPLVASLWEEMSLQTKCWANTRLSDLTMGDAFTLAQVTTTEGQRISAPLIIGADGGNSWVRQQIGVGRSGRDYEQHALTFTVELEGSLQQRAFQRFLGDGGPMALLPTFSEKHAVVVWSTSPEKVRRWKEEQNDEQLAQHLNDCLLEGPQRVPPLLEREPSTKSPFDIIPNILYEAEKLLDSLHYGLAMASHHPQPKFLAPPKIKAVCSPKFSFPLSCYQTQSYTKGRIALIGDAAHTVHPMAGQGLNLGFSDVQVLTESITKASRAGMDVSLFLHEYENNRQRNVTLTLEGIDTLQRLFANPDFVPLQHAKTLGMNLLQNLGPLRRQLALAATQGVQI